MIPHCGRDSMVEFQLPKLTTRVRFPSPAPYDKTERRLEDGVLAFSSARAHACLRIRFVRNSPLRCDVLHIWVAMRRALSYNRRVKHGPSTFAVSKEAGHDQGFCCE